MSSFCQHSPLKKSHLRRQRLRRKLPKDYVTNTNSTMKTGSFIERFRELLSKIHQQIDSNFNRNDLELFYQETDLDLSLTKKTPIDCPLICSFCEQFLFEPLTLSCGHTFCESCVLKSEFQSIKICPRCPTDVQGQSHSSIDYARSKTFSKNHFINDFFERSEKLNCIRQNSSMCRQAENEFEKGNYQQALEIYSILLEKFDDHYAYYGRGKTYLALEEFDKALTDIERVIALKPEWIKGHFLRGRILFDMKRYTAALLSTLHGLAINPDDQFGKQLTRKHLIAVLSEVEEQKIRDDFQFFSSTTFDNKEMMSSIEPTESQLLICQTKKSSPCLCSLFNVQHFKARDFECTICTNLLWCPVTTPCGHIFCRECLIRSIDNNQAQCPMCKKPLEEFFALLIQSTVKQTELISQMLETHFPQEFQERQRLYEQENIQGASLPINLTDVDESLIFEIPIFVCVLALPHSTCPLHVFEPRYRLMIRRAVETDSRTFGMCKCDENTNSFADYGTLLYIRGLIYTQDGRSIVDTVGQRRFRVVSRDVRDGYDTARIQLIRDHRIEDETEFNELFQMNRTTYERVRAWFNQLDLFRRTMINRQLENYPVCDDLTRESADGPIWAWLMLNVLPIEPDLQYNVLMSQSFRLRLKIINDAIDFLLNFHRHQRQQRQQQTNDEEAAVSIAETTTPITNE